MENTDFHNKIESTLNSLDGMKRAEANPFMLTRIMEKMKQPAPGILKPMLIWQAASTMIIVLGLNIAVGLDMFNNKTMANQPTEGGYFTNHIYNY